MTNDEMPGWLAAAERATFVAYVAGGDDLSQVHLAGFGGPQDATAHLAVTSMIDGVEVSVDTTLLTYCQSRELGDVLVVNNLIGSYAIGQPGVELPFTVTVVADDRQLSVEGIDVTFRGCRVEGDTRWIGECDLDNVRLRVETTSNTRLLIHRLDHNELADRSPATTESWQRARR